MRTSSCSRGSRSVASASARRLVTAAVASIAGAVVAAAPAPAPASTLSLHHYLCYSVPRRLASFTVSLDDVLYGPLGVKGRALRRLCNPADKNGEDPAAVASPDHLTGYPFRRQRGFPRFERRRGVQVVNQLEPDGTALDVVRPELLLVPAAKSLTMPIPPPATPGVDHYKCYRVRGARTRVAGLAVTDQLGSPTVNVRKPFRLCVAADKDGEGILDPTQHLMCYRVRTRPPRPAYSNVIWFADQFEAGVTHARRATELCVPSIVNPPLP
jgi:hypothetical protein